jgi:Uma2 family endonuclease
MVMVTTPHFTRADYMRLPEGYPAQLIEGDLVREPAPTYRHQRLIGRLSFLVRDVLGEERVLFSPLDFFLDDENVFQPDLVVFATPFRPRPEDRDMPLPVLVMEVLSPSSAWRDRGVKTRRYLRQGVKEVWLVDTYRNVVEIRTAEGVVEHGAGETASSTAVPELRVDVSALFRV